MKFSTYLFILILGYPLCAINALKANSSQKHISVIENYLRELKSLQASFVQYSNKGNVRGKIYIKRPNFLRIEYDSSDELLILARQGNLYFIDREKKDISSIPVTESPAYFLLNKDINITRDFFVTKVTNLKKSIILVSNDNYKFLLATIKIAG